MARTKEPVINIGAVKVHTTGASHILSHFCCRTGIAKGAVRVSPSQRGTEPQLADPYDCGKL